MPVGRRGESSKPDDKNPSQEARRRTRVREVDFLRLEGTVSGEPLSLFELKVRELLAASPSPREELEAKESQAGEREARRRMRISLACLRRKALSERQARCYELLYLKEKPARKIAEILGVSESRVRHLRSSIRKALERALRREEERKKIRKFLYSGPPLTRKQARVFRLRHLKNLSAREIARRMGRTEQGVGQMLKRAMERFRVWTREGR